MEDNTNPASEFKRSTLQRVAYEKVETDLNSFVMGRAGSSSAYYPRETCPIALSD
ncbi:hypothetical protein [Coxiella-like endosymbiont]|uniref:hypothetical protein n=1 Tax=Coxiella-like endosymbiont TaxID=1592897 RepID=UPI00272ADF4A|nr:hypothetical protein [Coxiella-like endosymbiont]